MILPAPESGAGFAPAKVNLFLHVLGRLPNGYHTLDSLAVFAGIGDSLAAFPSDALSLTIDGPYGAGLAADANNLVLRAANALAKEAGIAPRARLALTKRLPVASGIGGGSSDAAACLRLLGGLWQVTMPGDVLHRIALGLGADVPVCLARRPARMGGVGEVLGPVPVLPPFGLLLVNPGVAVSTAAVFRRLMRFSARADLPQGWDNAAAMAADLALVGNDLETAALAVCPAIGGVLAAIRTLDSCLLARMSGSGATCFGLFPGTAEAAAAATRLAQHGWWCWGGACLAAPKP